MACFLLVSNLYTLPSTDIFQRTPDRRYDNSSNRGPRRHSPDRQRSSEGADSRSSTPRRKESGIFMLCRYIHLPHCFLFCPPIGTEFKRKDSDLNLWSVCSQPALALISKSFYCPHVLSSKHYLCLWNLYTSCHGVFLSLLATMKISLFLKISFLCSNFFSSNFILSLCLKNISILFPVCSFFWFFCGACPSFSLIYLRT